MDEEYVIYISNIQPQKRLKSFAAKWMELEILTSSDKMPDSEPQILHVFSHMQNLRLKTKDINITERLFLGGGNQYEGGGRKRR
jgi:hypothetical protein